ncbi:retinitis pigmentosa 1-like 1 protein [Crotalus adamanteus]|uniref:Retinitis pigmentosa 1-like 1 protein n=1 Tax=Crotalus adamanteus TaxID=8729 RepID=A0AAW1CD17_CROAD
MSLPPVDCQFTSSYSNEQPLPPTVRTNAVTQVPPAKKITFYKSGDPQFAGIKMAINQHSFKSFNALVDDLSHRIPLPFGVRAITTPRGIHFISTLDQLEDGGCYLCSDKKYITPFNARVANRKLGPQKIDSMQGLLLCPNVLICVGQEPFKPIIMQNPKKPSSEKLPGLASHSNSNTLGKKNERRPSSKNSRSLLMKINNAPVSNELEPTANELQKEMAGSQLTEMDTANEAEEKEDSGHEKKQIEKETIVQTEAASRTYDQIIPSSLPNASPEDVVHEWLRKIPSESLLMKCDMEKDEETIELHAEVPSCSNNQDSLQEECSEKEDTLQEECSEKEATEDCEQLAEMEYPQEEKASEIISEEAETNQEEWIDLSSGDGGSGEESGVGAHDCALLKEKRDKAKFPEEGKTEWEDGNEEEPEKHSQPLCSKLEGESEAELAGVQEVIEVKEDQDHENNNELDKNSIHVDQNVNDAENDSNADNILMEAHTDIMAKEVEKNPSEEAGNNETEPDSSANEAVDEKEAKINSENQSVTKDDTESSKICHQTSVKNSPMIQQRSSSQDPVWVLKLLKKIEKEFMMHYVSAMNEFKVKWNLTNSEELNLMIAELKEDVSRRIQKSVEEELNKIKSRTGKKVPKPPENELKHESTPELENRRRRLTSMLSLNNISDQSTNSNKQLESGNLSYDSDKDDFFHNTIQEDERYDKQLKGEEYCPCDVCMRKKNVAKTAQRTVVVMAKAPNPVLKAFDLQEILRMKNTGVAHRKTEYDISEAEREEEAQQEAKETVESDGEEEAKCEEEQEEEQEEGQEEEQEGQEQEQEQEQEEGQEEGQEEEQKEEQEEQEEEQEEGQEEQEEKQEEGQEEQEQEQEEEQEEGQEEGQVEQEEKQEEGQEEKEEQEEEQKEQEEEEQEQEEWQEQKEQEEEQEQEQEEGQQEEQESVKEQGEENKEEEKPNIEKEEKEGESMKVDEKEEAAKQEDEEESEKESVKEKEEEEEGKEDEEQEKEVKEEPGGGQREKDVIYEENNQEMEAKSEGDKELNDEEEMNEEQKEIPKDDQEAEGEPSVTDNSAVEMDENESQGDEPAEIVGESQSVTEEEIPDSCEQKFEDDASLEAISGTCSETAEVEEEVENEDDESGENEAEEEDSSESVQNPEDDRGAEENGATEAPEKGSEGTFSQLSQEGSEYRSDEEDESKKKENISNKDGDCGSDGETKLAKESKPAKMYPDSYEEEEEDQSSQASTVMGEDPPNEDNEDSHRISKKKKQKSNIIDQDDLDF